MSSAYVILQTTVTCAAAKW